MKKFVSIESLRGWMAWWVVAAHALEVSGTPRFLPSPLLKLLGMASIPVQVFMVISGFVICHLLLSRREPIGVFLYRRAWRLAPLFFAATIIAIALRPLYFEAFIANPWTGSAAGRIARQLSENADWMLHGVLHLFMLHGAVPDSLLQGSSEAFLAPTWSISLEWQFYLASPLLVGALIAWKKWSLPVLAATLLFSLAALSGRWGQWTHESFLFLAIVYFLIGITARLIFRHLAGESGFPVAASLSTLGMAAVHLLFASGEAHSSLQSFAIVMAICGLFFAIAASEAGLVAWNNRIWRGLVRLIALNPVLTGLGKVSYSTYLIHIPAFSAVIGGGMLIAGRSDQGFIVMLTGLAVIVTIPLSFLAYALVEKPGIAQGNRLLRRFEARAGAAA